MFVIQVCAGSGTKVSDTDLDDVIAKIEERMGDSFKENEVVHTFGSTGTLSIHGLTVPHIEPSEIAEDRRIRVVLFKENLSTGWDCPRAETMMSFRRAEDATYIAQLLGRMVRTPLQCHVLVDDSLNDVRLFLPYFNQDTVQKVIDELQATEGGEIPTVVDGESLEEQNYDTWSVHNQRKKTQKLTVGQLSIFDYPNGFQEEPAVAPSTAVGDMPNSGVVAVNQGRVDSELPAEGQHQTIPLETVPRNDVHAGQEIERTSEGDQSEKKEQPVLTPAVSQMSMLPTIDREGITKFINEQGYLTYIVRAVKINSYLKSLMSLAGLLSQFNICITAAEDVKNDVAELIRNYVNGLHDAGKYDELTKQVMKMKLSVQIFDVFGEKIQSDNQIDMFTASESDLDRQLRVADAKMGGCGFHLAYGRKYIDFDNPNAFKVDCILFAFDSELRKSGYSEEDILLFNGDFDDAMTKEIFRTWQVKNFGKTNYGRSVEYKHAIVDYFKSHAKILIVTDAGSEGLNLQFCNTIINYDLPWNPQKIEQRIGRCHRYGQTHDVVAINLLNTDNEADRRVYDILSKKFELFEGVFGASDVALGALESGVSFEKRILDIYQNCKNITAVRKAFAALNRQGRNSGID